MSLRQGAYICLCILLFSCKGTQIAKLKSCEIPSPQTLDDSRPEYYVAGLSNRELQQKHVCLKLISHVNIVDVASGKILPDQYVLIADDTIVEFTSGKRLHFEIPRGMCVLKIDGTGKYLAPGLCDMHSHYCGKLRLDYLVNGITTVRVPDARHAHYYEKLFVAREELLGPRVLCSTPANVQIRNSDSLTRVADSLNTLSDWLYISSNMLPQFIPHQLAYAREKNLVPAIDFRNALLRENFPRGTVFEQCIYELNTGLADSAANYWFMARLENDYPTSPENYPVISKETENFMTGILRSHPDRFCMATEAGSHDRYNKLIYPGQAFKNEMERLKAHLSNEKILRICTMNAAALYRESRQLRQARADWFGEIKPGYKADMVLLDANPLENIFNYFKISAVFINGNYLDTFTLDEMKKMIRKFGYYE